MYVCPTCGKQVETENNLTKHFLNCWKENHPYHKAKDAPRSDDINTRIVNEDVMNFFSSFKG